jgi:hypothetical protein
MKRILAVEARFVSKKLAAQRFLNALLNALAMLRRVQVEAIDPIAQL